MHAPPDGTVERWAWDFVHATTLEHKLAPPPRPVAWEHSPPARRLVSPGRPSELVPIARPPKTPRSLHDANKRAQLLHTFLHHELQAAELMAWALLAFPESPHEFKKGLLRILDDEVRHAGLYAEHLARLGSRVGAFGVRDWFWERVAKVERPAQFVALLGIGFEGGNLDHSARFAAAFRDAGDEEGARMQELVGTEEIAHVRFAVRWFETFSGPLTFESWLAALPPPLTPIVMRGDPMNGEARARAGLSREFVAALAAYDPRPAVSVGRE
jgi:uncharacterized ferritin-like protein (DUF455 family)